MAGMEVSKKSSNKTVKQSISTTDIQTSSLMEIIIKLYCSNVNGLTYPLSYKMHVLNKQYYFVNTFL